MVRVRFAPSPTGFLHIGNARTALFNYLFAKKQGGEFILRVEDTDRERSKQEYIKQVYEDLSWLGLEWNEGPDKGGPHAPYLQSERVDKHKSYLERLLKSGHAYYCYCTEERLKESKAALLAEGKSAIYDNHCRSLTADDVATFEKEGIKPSIRFKMPEKEIIVHDIIRGDVPFDGSQISDFVIARPDGTPTFHLAVTVDDGEMGITHVVRGEDHFSNTPRHIAIFEACGFPVPTFAHMPLTMGPGGAPLSKRFGAMSLAEYRKLGYLPEAVANYMALLGWSPGDDKELFTWEELIQAFSLDRVAKSPATFDFTKMNWVSGEHIRRLSDEDYIRESIEYVLREKLIEEEIYKRRPEWYEQAMMVFKDNIQSFGELKDRLELLEEDSAFGDHELLASDEAQATIKELINQLSFADDLSPDVLQAAFKETQKASGIKGKGFFLPTRIALTGKEHGPDLKRFMLLFGKKNVIQRLKKAVKG